MAQSKLPFFYQKVIINLIIIVLIHGCNPTKYVPDGDYLLNSNKIEIIGDKKGVERSDIENLLKQKPNHTILNFIKLHLAIYNLVDPQKEELRQVERKLLDDERNRKRVLKGKKPKEKFYFTAWLQEIGEKPVVYDPYKTKNSNKQIRLYLKNKGYYSSVVYDSVFYSGQKANIIYTVIPGTPYSIDSIIYKIEDSTLTSIIIKDTPNSLIRKNSLFDIDLLQNERIRITNYLKNKGYYKFSKEFIYYVADSFAFSKKVNLTIGIKSYIQYLDSGVRVDKHYQYKIGQMSIFTDYNAKDALVNKDKYLSKFTKQTYDTSKIFFYNSGYFIIKPQTILRENYLFYDSLYQQDNVQKTYRYLSSLQMFKSLDIVFNEQESNDSAEDIKSINCQVFLTPQIRQSYSIELEGSNSSGNWGIAGNLIYKHKNLFHGAENLDFRIRSAQESQSNLFTKESKQGQALLNTFEFGLEGSVSFPRFLLPFSSETFSRKYKIKSSMSVAYNYQNNPDYNGSITNFKFGYFWQNSKKQYINHFFNPFEINLVNVSKMSDKFKTLKEYSYIKYSYEPQFITASTYSYLFDNQDIRKERDHIYYRINLESAGNFLNIFHRLKGEKRDSANFYELFSNRYSQYLRFDIDFRYYHKVTDLNDKIVYRTFLGIAYPYGNSEKGLPYVKKYYSGGANSIRAWKVKDLGPGSYKPANDSLSLLPQLPNQTGDIKFEGNLEYRFKMFWLVEGALFLDIGNIWSLQKESEDRNDATFEFSRFYKEIAVGTGMGLRLDFSFFLFRFDFGLKLREPNETIGKRWILSHRNFNSNDWALNIGIGYPF